jgi:hypothetical protein
MGLAPRHARSMDTETTWRERVTEWKASGKTCAAFCEGQPFSLSTLRQWQYRLKKREREPIAEGQKVRMVAIARATGTPRGASEPLILEAKGARIQLRRGFDPVLLRQVLQALGETT